MRKWVKHRKMRISLQEKYKIIIISVLILICCFITYYFHVIFETGTVFTHFFYIPIILAALWWNRKGLVVAIFLSALLPLSHFFIRGYTETANDFFRALMFLIVAFAAIIVSERLGKSYDEIKRKNIQLKKLDELKTTFLNVTSHELRTPMTTIKGYMQLLLKQGFGELNEEQKKSLDVVLRNTNRLDRLVQDILDTSLLESGSMKFSLEKTDMNQLMKEVAETLQPSAEIKGITITMDTEDDIPELVIDRDRIKQVCNDLVNNAIKFSPDGSVINVRAKKQEEKVLVEIQDHGKGISRDKQQKVFEPFYQIDSGMDRSFGGTGLGLFISRGIVLSHDGKIWVESEKGKGSIFRFMLPIKPIQDVEGTFEEIDMFNVETDKEKSRRE